MRNFFKSTSFISSVSWLLFILIFSMPFAYESRAEAPVLDFKVTGIGVDYFSPSGLGTDNDKGAKYSSGVNLPSRYLYIEAVNVGGDAIITANAGLVAYITGTEGWTKQSYKNYMQGINLSQGQLIKSGDKFIFIGPSISSDSVPSFTATAWVNLNENKQVLDYYPESNYDNNILTQDIYVKNNCGNGVINLNEACDGNLFPETEPTCARYSFPNGKMRCKSDCSMIDYSYCGVKESPKPEPKYSLETSLEDKNKLVVGESNIINSTVFIQCSKITNSNSYLGMYPEAEMTVGTGVVIDPAGYILTNRHVVENKGDCYIYASKAIGQGSNQGQRSGVKIVALSDSSDLAVLKLHSSLGPVTQSFTSYINLANSYVAQPGSNAVYYGYPIFNQGENGLNQVLAKKTGLINSYRDGQVLAAIPSSHGASGSGLYDLDGRYIGTVFAARELNADEVGSQTMAVSAEISKKFILDLIDRGVLTGSIYNKANLVSAKQDFVKDLTIPNVVSTPVKNSDNQAKVNKGAEVAKQIYLSGTNIDAYLKYSGHKKNSKDQLYAYDRFTMPLVGKLKLTQSQRYAINNFLVYSNSVTAKLNVKDRLVILNSYKKQYKNLPKTEADWLVLLGYVR